MRILIEMRLTPRWVPYSAGYDVVPWAAIGMISTSDQEIFDYTRLNGYALTNDLDFPRILAHRNESKPSVVLLRGGPLVPELRGATLLIARQLPPTRSARRASRFVQTRLHQRIEGMPS